MISGWRQLWIRKCESVSVRERGNRSSLPRRSQAYRTAGWAPGPAGQAQKQGAAGLRVRTSN